MVQNYLQLYRNKQHTRGTPTLYLLAIVLQGRYTMYVFSAHPTANRWSPIAHNCYTHTWTVSGSCSNVYLHYSSSIQDLKHIKDVGMACQKVCKQGMDGMIVKVNLQSLIPASFSH